MTGRSLGIGLTGANSPVRSVKKTFNIPGHPVGDEVQHRAEQDGNRLAEIERPGCAGEDRIGVPQVRLNVVGLALVRRQNLIAVFNPCPSYVSDELDRLTGDLGDGREVAIVG
jgi:hypothetical protein